MSEETTIVKDAEAVLKAQRSRIDELEVMLRARPGFSDTTAPVKKFSLCKAINAHRLGGAFNRDVWDKLGAGYEREVLEATQKTMTFGVDSAGGFTVPMAETGFIEMLRSTPILDSLGVTKMPGLTKAPLPFGRQTGGVTLRWGSEDVADTTQNQTYDQIMLSPKNCRASTEISNTLLSMDSEAGEMQVRNDLSRAYQEGLELAFFNGAGGPEPLGVLNSAGIGSVSFSAATDKERVEKIQQMVETLEVAKANMSDCKWVMHPTDWWKLAKLQQVQFSGATTAAQLVLGGLSAGSGPRMLQNYPVLTSTNVTVGTVAIGNWSEALLPSWGSPRVKVTSEGKTLVLLDNSLVALFDAMDVNIRHPASFCKGVSF